jgi:hypothetical protein
MAHSVTALIFLAPGMVGATPRFAGSNMGVRPDAPTIETIVLATFYEIIKVY